MSKLNRVKFYTCIPAEFKTKQDYMEFKTAGKNIVNYLRKPISLTDSGYVWYQVDKEFYRLEDISTNVVLKDINFYHFELLAYYPSEVWTQKLADEIWNSKVCYECFEYIPKEYVKQEWIQIMELCEKRVEYFGLDDGIPTTNIDKLSEYWGSFETEIKKAIKVKEKVKAHHAGDTIPLHKVDMLRKNREKIDANFQLIWDSLKVKNQQIVNNLYEIYSLAFASKVSDEFFDNHWIIDKTDYYLLDYKEAFEKMLTSKNPIEKL